MLLRKQCRGHCPHVKNMHVRPLFAVSDHTPILYPFSRADALIHLFHPLYHPFLVAVRAVLRVVCLAFCTHPMYTTLLYPPHPRKLHQCTREGMRSAVVQRRLIVG